MPKPQSPAPPQKPATAITRRGLFTIAAGSAAMAASPLAARGFGSGFTHGVASGEPGQSQVLLWTRYASHQDVTLEWQVSTDQGFTEVVAGGSATASPDRDYCAKAWAKGLKPGQWYYYRFTAPDGSQSDIGRTRTLPEGDVGKFRMAVFSCSNYGFGWFNAYAHAAQANDADLAVHLGDYLYEYQRGEYPDADVAHPHRKLWPENEIVVLADYRLRYATYRSDPDLRRIHQSLPMICIWDDHETANDSWNGGAENHQSDSEGDWEVRKQVARRVHREWMPISDDPYAAYEVGDLATLFRLDTRIEGREEQFNFGRIIAGKQSGEEIAAALKSFAQGDYLQADRQLLGAEQEAWLTLGLKASRRAGKPWQVLVQQVLMGRLATPTNLLEALGEGAADYVRRRVIAATLASRSGLPANMDAWDGYPAARDRVLKAALEADANLLVLAGDTHNGWAFELDHAGAGAGVEFGVHSVTSPGLEGYLGAVQPVDLARGLVEHNSGLKWADTSQRGYAVVELTPSHAHAEYRFVDGIRTRHQNLAGTKRISAAADSRKFIVS